jgi:nucleoside-diphosphate-sugar epimerase
LRVGITGGRGFIGSHLARACLARGDEVRVLSRATIERFDGRVIHGDLTDPESAGALRRFADGLDVLFHCAGEIRDPTRMRAVHVEGTRAMLAAAEGRIGRWVQLSSVGVYGPVRAGVVDEESSIAPVGPYETTKAEADAIVLEASRTGDLGAIAILRPSNVFGAGMPNDALRALVGAVRRRLFFFIGPKGASANYVDVEDVVGALVACALSGSVGLSVYNLSDWATMEEFVGAIAATFGRSAPRGRVPEWVCRLGVRALVGVPGFPLTLSRVDALTCRVRYASERISREVGFVAEQSLVARLQRFVVAERASGWPGGRVARSLSDGR